MPRCLLALGSNLGDRCAILSDACAAVANLPATQLLARSSWHATSPIGGAAGQAEFLNGALLIDTSLAPQELALSLQAIEAQLGRQRVVRWDARTIDIDVLLYGSQIIETPDLIVPHPRMAFRRFVLEPAVEIAGEMFHPTTRWTLARLLAHLETAPRYVVVTANQQAVAELLLGELCRRHGCRAATLGADVPPGKAVGTPPVLAVATVDQVAKLFDVIQSGKAVQRPALILAIDVDQPRNLVETAESAGFSCQSAIATRPVGDLLRLSGIGPLARITSDDPTVVLQESSAALRCIWPDLPSPINN